MSKTNKTSEIIASLNDYVERQKDVLDEESARLLKQGEESFNQLIIEKQENFSKALDLSTEKPADWQAQAKGAFQSVLVSSRKVVNFFRKVISFLRGKLKMKSRS